jgi:Protein of unknown function (DUF1257)
MSHFTRLKTKMTVREHLTGALDDLGYRCEEGDVEIRGYGGNRTKVQIRVPTANPGYDIGFTESGGSYALIADWWGIEDLDAEVFARDLTKRYAYRATRATLEEQGFALVDEEVAQDGRLHLTLRRTA